MWLLDKIKGLFSRGRSESVTDSQMQSHINLWWEIFAGKACWNKARSKPLPIAVLSTSYLSNLICGELKYELSDKYLNEQIGSHLIPQIDKIVQFALVGGYAVIKPYITKTGDIYYDFATSQNFEPIAFDEVGRVVEGVFIDCAKVNKKDYIRKEHHLWHDGLHEVQNKVYLKGSNTELPLSTVPRWARLQQIGKIESEIPMIATLRTPYANNLDPASDLPISMYANSVKTLENIDYAHTSYLSEMKKMESKIFARSDLFLKDEEKGSAIVDDYFYKMEVDADINKEIMAFAPVPREEHYKNALNTELRLYEIETGLSSGTFTFDVNKGLVTATQVLSEDKTTYNTARQMQKQLKPVLEAVAEISATLASFYGITVEKGEPGIEFGDSVFEDTGVEFTRRLQLVQAGMYKPELFNEWYFGVPEQKAKKMMGGIQSTFGGDE